VSKVLVNPEIIIWARKRNGFTVDALAKRMNLEPREITMWETGDKIPSYIVLEKLAYKYFKIPLALFFFTKPPDIEDPRNNFRRLPDYELKKFSYDTLQKLRLGQAYQESLAALVPKGVFKYKIFHELELKGLSAVQLAKKARDYLGVSVQRQFAFKGVEEAFKYWRYAIEQVGIFTFKDAFKDKFISGFCLLHAEWPIIFINNSNAFSRQIFTLVHELGHILFGVHGVSDVDETYFRYLNSHDKMLEIRCNEFAAEMLVPADTFLGDIVLFEKEGFGIIPELAKKYSVSREVILRRLLEQRAISAEDYEALSAKWNKDYLRTSGGRKGGNYYLTRLAYLGEGFTRLAFDNHAAGRLSPVDLANHLNVKARSLKKLSAFIRA
jgi:Zn-dependent peptidase ImmA (M78 family)